MLVHRAQQSLLGQQRGLVKRAAHAYADHDWRAGVRAGFFHDLHHKILHALQTVGRLEHLDLAHVFAAEALGSDGDLHLITRYELIIDHGRRIVAGVDAVKRIAYDGLAEITVTVSLTDAFVDGFFNRAFDVDFLTNVDEHARHARILTDRYIVLVGDLVVFDDLIENALRDGEGLAGAAGGNAILDIAGQVTVGFDAQSAHHFGDLFSFDVSHNTSLFKCCGWYRSACRHARSRWRRGGRKRRFSSAFR